MSYQLEGFELITAAPHEMMLFLSLIFEAEIDESQTDKMVALIGNFKIIINSSSAQKNVGNFLNPIIRLPVENEKSEFEQRYHLYCHRTDQKNEYTEKGIQDPDGRTWYVY